MCILCGDPSEKTFCSVCFRMRAGAAKILPDMTDLASLTRHLCRIGSVALRDTEPQSCSKRIRRKWPGMRRRHTQVLGHSEATMITPDELCGKMVDDSSATTTVLCSYCHTYPSSGLDRMDSDKGYTLSNTVPCCALCNFTKGDLMLSDFFLHAKKACAKWQAETCDAAVSFVV